MADRNNRSKKNNRSKRNNGRASAAELDTDEINRKKRKQIAMLRRVHRKTGVAFLIIGALLFVLAAKIFVFFYKTLLMASWNVPIPTALTLSI